ncbi:YIP1 family protein [Candidatus Poribacteria bacterium]|nr:YIP1 family protein [Candidatus Poribacteria bacterium]
MKESLQNVIDIIINPAAVFTRLKYNPKWIVALTVYCLLSFVLAWTLLPYTQKLLTARAVERTTHAIIPIAVFSTVYTILMAILLSIVLTIIAKSVGIHSDIRFKHVCAAFFHVMLIRTMTFLVNAGLLPVFRDIQEIHTTIDGRVIPGLHLLAVSLENQHLSMFLSYINPVAVWYVFVLTTGVHIFAGVSKVKALVVALIIWLFRISLDTTFIAIFLP